MKISLAHGYNDFVICLGYEGYYIKEYFLNYFLKKLSIAIPTYNRSALASAQLQFLINDCKHLSNEVDLWVFNNCSTDDTEQRIMEITPLINFRYVRNEHNIGLIGNYLKIIDTVETEWVWVVGNDDPLYEDIVAKILARLHKNIGVVHVNHRCVSGINGEVVYERFYEGDFSTMHGRKLINALLGARNFGGFMFITANIIQVRHAKQVLQSVSHVEKNLLAFPLYLNLAIGSRFGIDYIEEPLIDCTYDLCSWKNRIWTVLKEEVPRMLVKAGEEKLSKKVLSGLVAKQMGNRINPKKYPLWVSVFQWRAALDFLKWRLKRTLKMA